MHGDKASCQVVQCPWAICEDGAHRAGRRSDEDTRLGARVAANKATDQGEKREHAKRDRACTSLDVCRKLSAAMAVRGMSVFSHM